LKKTAYSRYSLERFLNELASDRPTPGGGSAAALAGALGISLLEMTVRINGRRSQGSGKKSVHRKTGWLAGARRSLLGLMSQDAKAFEKIAALHRKKEKGSAWQRALKGGAAVPYKIARIVSDAGGILNQEAPKTSSWLFSDLIESSSLLLGAFDSAALYVEVNLKGVQDDRILRGMRADLSQMRTALEDGRKVISRKAS
jgi:formiminotetrahydrofolate cyclodeaminase